MRLPVQLPVRLPVRARPNIARIDTDPWQRCHQGEKKSTVRRLSHLYAGFGYQAQSCCLIDKVACRDLFSSPSSVCPDVAPLSPSSRVEQAKARPTA